MQAGSGARQSWSAACSSGLSCSAGHFPALATRARSGGSGQAAFPPPPLSPTGTPLRLQCCALSWGCINPTNPKQPCAGGALAA